MRITISDQSKLRRAQGCQQREEDSTAHVGIGGGITYLDKELCIQHGSYTAPGLPKAARRPSCYTAQPTKQSDLRCLQGKKRGGKKRAKTEGDENCLHCIMNNRISNSHIKKPVVNHLIHSDAQSEKRQIGESCDDSSTSELLSSF